MTKAAPKKVNTSRAREKYSQASVIRALVEARGVKAHAARKLGCSRNTVDRYIADHPTVGEAYMEVLESNIDEAEGVLMRNVDSGDTTSLLFYLRTVGRKRGYGDKMELTGSGGAPLVPPVIQVEIINRPQNAGG